MKKLAEADCLTGQEQSSADIIFSNPPFMDFSVLEGKILWTPTQAKFYPQVSLVGGETGMEIYERIISQSARVLTSEGLLIMQMQEAQRLKIEEVIKRAMGDSMPISFLRGYEKSAIMAGNPTMMKDLLAIRSTLK